MERISDKEVLDACYERFCHERVSALGTAQSREAASDDGEQRLCQGSAGNGQSIVLPMPGHSVNQSGTTNSIVFDQSGLEMIFEAIYGEVHGQLKASKHLRIFEYVPKKLPGRMQKFHKFFKKGTTSLRFFGGFELGQNLKKQPSSNGLRGGEDRTNNSNSKNMEDGEEMQLLSNDIIIEILSWLPAKSLLRFRWTCKYWFDLITNNDFFIKIHAHRSTITKSVLSFCFMNGGKSYDNQLFQGHYLNYNNGTNYDVPSDVHCLGDEPIKGILGSCNGLLLLMTKHRYLCISNPCTKQDRFLPSPLSSQPVYNKNSVFIPGDTFGFGYDQTIDDYKVIRIRHYRLHYDDLLRFDVQIYTLGKNSWRRIIGCNIPYRLYNHCSTAPGVFMNGALYWMDSLHQNIISFDIVNENFQHVSKTPNLLTDECFVVDLPQLQVFEGSLCLVTKINHQRNSPVDVWVMNDNDNNNNNNNNESPLWTKLFTIHHLCYFPIKLLRYTMNGEILMLNNHKDLVLYDPKSKCCQTISTIWEDRNQFLVLEVYTESLLSLNSGTCKDQQKREERHNTNKDKRKRKRKM